jgi:hypothetical protein
MDAGVLGGERADAAVLGGNGEDVAPGLDDGASAGRRNGGTAKIVSDTLEFRTCFEVFGGDDNRKIAGFAGAEDVFVQ